MGPGGAGTSASRASIRRRRGGTSVKRQLADLDLARVEAHVAARAEHALKRLLIGPGDLLDPAQRAVRRAALVGTGLRWRARAQLLRDVPQRDVRRSWQA